MDDLKRKYFLLKFLCIVSIGFHYSEANAQELSFTHFGLKDGLPSSEIYQSIQDEKGFMWFGTDRGLVKFDGYDFTTFTNENGLAGNIVFGFHKDHKNRSWFYTHHNGIGYIKEGEIYIPPFNEALKRSLKKMSRNPNVISSMYVDLNDTIWLAFKLRNNIVSISPEGVVNVRSLPADHALGKIIAIDSIGILFGKGKYKKNKIENMLSILTKEKNYYIDYHVDTIDMVNGISAIKSKRNSYYFSQNQSITRVDDSTLTQHYRLPQRTTMSVYEDSKMNVWVGMYQKGVWQFINGDLHSTPRKFLESYTVTSVYEDIEGGIWFTTLEAGIFYTSVARIYSKKICIEPISSVCADSLYTYVGTKHGRIFKSYKHAKSELIYDDLEFIFEIKKNKNFLVLATASTDKTKYTLINDSTLIIPFSIFLTSSQTDSIWIYNPSKFYDSRLLPSSVSINDENHFTDFKIESICRWNGINYLGSNNGLHKIRDLNSNQFIHQQLPFDLWIKDMVSSDNNLFLATKHHGLVIFNGTETWSITKKDGLPLNYIETMVLENDSILWLGSKKGISKVQLSFKKRAIKIVNINYNDGLISNEVNDLSYSKGTLWVGTNEGLSFFDTDQKFSNKLPPPVYIEHIRINGLKQPINQPNSNLFNSQSSAFDFNFIGLSYKSLSNIKYKYRLKGFDSTWSETFEHEVRYMLSPGEYTFEVMAKNSRGIWSEKAASYHFTILLPVWKRWWFICIYILLIFLGVYLIYSKRVNRLKKQAQQEVKIAQSQHQSLSAQLKPHFIFNALNSINNYIRKNDKESSSEYLSLFARLIRQILTNSNELLVSIEKELKLVEQYLQIEQLRFKEQMTYRINIDRNIDLESMKIPTQLIQPYIENAIWHGIMNKKKSGHILLDLQLEDEQLICVIEDDGVGRAATINSKSNKSGNRHKSLSMNINTERLELIEAIFKRPVHMHIEDLIDHEGQANGTRVIVKLPIIQTKTKKYESRLSR